MPNPPTRLRLPSRSDAPARPAIGPGDDTDQTFAFSNRGRLHPAISEQLLQRPYPVLRAHGFQPGGHDVTCRKRTVGRIEQRAQAARKPIRCRQAQSAYALDQIILGDDTFEPLPSPMTGRVLKWCLRNKSATTPSGVSGPTDIISRDITSAQVARRSGGVRPPPRLRQGSGRNPPLQYSRRD